MTSDAFIREYAWAIALAAAALFLASRRVMRRLRERRELRERALAAESVRSPTVGPEDYARARKQFLLTLALLIVIVIVSILTPFQ